MESWDHFLYKLYLKNGKTGWKLLKRGRTPFERVFFGLFSKTAQDIKLKFNREVYLNLPKLFFKIIVITLRWQLCLGNEKKKQAEKRSKRVGPLLSEGFLNFSQKRIKTLSWNFLLRCIWIYRNFFLYHSDYPQMTIVPRKWKK